MAGARRARQSVWPARVLAGRGSSSPRRALAPRLESRHGAGRGSPWEPRRGPEAGPWRWPPADKNAPSPGRAGDADRCRRAASPVATTGSCLCRPASWANACIGLGVDHGPLFNPADLVLFGLHLEKAAAVLQHFQRLAVGHLGHAIGDGGHPVMQIHLARGDVDRLVMFTVKPLHPPATTEKTTRSKEGTRASEAPDVTGRMELATE